MLRTLPLTQNFTQVQRIAGIALFTILTAISAKMSFEIGTEVPFTMQVLVVLLSGMVLGARDGAFSQLAYVALIFAGQPIDARGLGTAALAGPTGGFLIGFIIAAFVAGFLVEKSGSRLWQRWLAGIVGAGVIYLFGVSHLSLYTGMDIAAAWEVGAAPFLLPDIIKAFIAAGLVESMHFGLNYQNTKNKQ